LVGIKAAKQENEANGAGLHTHGVKDDDQACSPTKDTLVVKETTPTMKKRKKTLKVLAKENTKMTDWVVKKSDISEEMAPEENLVEIRD
jgi:hypothetical protein